MSKGSINKVLIISLLLIWSVVVYQLISSFFGTTESDSTLTAIPVGSPDFKTQKKETFDLPEIMRDPFLGTSFVPKNENPVTVISREFINTKRDVWPSIRYYGFVRGETSNRPLILLRIDDNLQRIRQNSRVDGLIIQQVFKDSIVIKLKNEKRIFHKEKG